VVRASTPGPEGSAGIGTPFKLGDQGIRAWVARTGETLVVNDVSKDSRYLYVEDWKDTRAELTVPIAIGDDVVGVLDIQSSAMDAFDEMDVVTAQTLANQLAVAIENTRLFGESREMAVLEERNRMAREIHDTLAQGLTGIVLQLEAGEQALGHDTDEVQGHLTRARDLARECLQEARRSVWNLLPQALEESPIHEALQDEVQRYNKSGPERVSFEISGDRRQLPAGIQTALLRICQESLNNVKKHAHANEAIVHLAFQPDAVSLEVSDDGRGFEPRAGGDEVAGGGFGLIGMRQRASLLRGELAVISGPDSGTRVQVTIPTA
jgi:signal transduction histidine kinase